jgi:hypothetical protein
MIKCTQYDSRNWKKLTKAQGKQLRILEQKHHQFSCSRILPLPKAYYSLTRINKIKNGDWQSKNQQSQREHNIFCMHAKFRISTRLLHIVIKFTKWWYKDPNFILWKVVPEYYLLIYQIGVEYYQILLCFDLE